jgi:hypothetical protein
MRVEPGLGFEFDLNKAKTITKRLLLVGHRIS